MVHSPLNNIGCRFLGHWTNTTEPVQAKKRVCVGWWGVAHGRVPRLSEGWSATGSPPMVIDPPDQHRPLPCHAMPCYRSILCPEKWYRSVFVILFPMISIFKTNIETKIIDFGVRLDTIEKASGMRKSGHPLGTWVEKTDKKLHLAGGQRL